MKKFFFDKYFLLIVLIIVLSVTIFFPLYRNNKQQEEANKEIKDLEIDIKELESKNKKFKEVISSLKSDEYAEEQARINFGLKKNGESVVVVVDNNSNNKINKNDDCGFLEDGKDNIKKWWGYFFSKKNTSKLCS